MIKGFLDSALGVVEESVKTFCQELFHNIVKLVNVFCALVLSILPRKTVVLEGNIHGWELRPKIFEAPKLPWWMENAASTFNAFLHEKSHKPDLGTEPEYECGLEDNDSTISSVLSLPRSQLSLGHTSQHERKNAYGPMQFVNVVLQPLKDIYNSKQSSSLLRWLWRSGPMIATPSCSGSYERLTEIYSLANKRFTSTKHYAHHTFDKRKGVIEDLQLTVELFIERVFDVVQNGVFHILSPLETLQLVRKKLFFHTKMENGIVSVQTAALCKSDTEPSYQQPILSLLTNADAHTCKDIITGLGYPYEAFKVITADGYVLLMERIPRQDSQKVLYMQHGLLGSSLCWVSNGVVGSEAFAAYDQGYDVFLGNFRGFASREHTDEHISKKRYWRYSINEHGTQDVPAMMSKIHEIKVTELKHLQVVLEYDEHSSHVQKQPYTICAVGHSVGAAAILMYIVTRRLANKVHRLSRIILMSPVGLHENSPFFMRILANLVPAMAPLLSPIIPGFYVPGTILRLLFYKLARDFQVYPAFGGLVQTLFSYTVGGDSSNWVAAMGLSHFNMYDSPGISYRVAVHLTQMRHSNQFIMFNFGSTSANMEAYGTPFPLDIGRNYDKIDIPVDVVAGRKDRLIPPCDVKRHYQLMKEKGCQVTYEEFEYAHLDFGFAHQDELLAYVMSRLLHTPPDNEKQIQGQTTGKKRSFKIS
eukprot:c25698_g1_i1 orf=197-2302(+)